MGVSCIVIADSTSAVSIGVIQQQFGGLAMIMNEDVNNNARLLFVPQDEYGNSQTPSHAAVLASGSMLKANAEPQCQFQDDKVQSNPAQYWVVCEPGVIEPFSTIPVYSHVYRPKPDMDLSSPVHTLVDASFVLPAVSATVNIVVFDSSLFAVGDYVDRTTNAGVFIGGVFFDITAIPDATHMTIRNRGLPGAVVTGIG